MNEQVSVDCEDLRQLMALLDGYMDSQWEAANEGKDFTDEYMEEFQDNEKFLAEMRKKYDVE